MHDYKYFLFLCSLAFISCDQQFLPAGSSMLKHGQNPFTRDKQKNPVDARFSAAVQVQSLAIGNEMISNLIEDLKVNIALTDEQYNIIATSAKDELESSVGALNIESSFALAELEPLEIASPAVVAGAISSLSLLSSQDKDLESQVTTSENPSESIERNSTVAKNILGSTFKSLKDHQESFPQEKIANLASSMVGSAVAKLKDAGLGNENAGLGVKAITSGAMSSLESAGFNKDSYGTVAKAMMKGAVSNLRIEDIGETNLPDVIGKATEGAVSGMNLISSSSIDEKISLAGSLASGSLESMQSLNLSNTVIVNSIKGVSKGTISGLGQSNFAVEELASAVKSVTSSMVSSLKTVTSDAELIGTSVGAVASGAVSGFGKIGIDESTLASSGLIQNVINGTMANINSIGLPSSRVAITMNNVVGGAISSLGASGVSSTSYQQSLIKEVISSTMNNFSVAGIKDVSTISIAMESMTKGASSALIAAGVQTDKMSETISIVTQKSIEHISSIGISTAADLKTITGKVTKGAISGLTELKNSGNLSFIDVEANANSVTSSALKAVDSFSNKGLINQSDMTTFSVAIAGGMIDGMSYAGGSASEINKLKTGVTATMADDLSRRGFTESDINNITSEISSNTEKSISFAANLQTNNFSFCQKEYSNSLSDSEIILKTSKNIGAIFCLRDTEPVCPIFRFMSTVNIEWIPNSTNLKLCEMVKIYHEDYSKSQVSTTPTTSPITTPGSSYASDPFANTTPVVIVANPIVGESDTTALDLTVSGTGVDFYRYKIGPVTTTNCFFESSYSNPVAVSVPLTYDLSSLDDGQYQLCLIGGNYFGVWQSFYSAYIMPWTKNTSSQPSSNYGFAYINEFSPHKLELYIKSSGNLDTLILSNNLGATYPLTHKAVNADSYEVIDLPASFISFTQAGGLFGEILLSDTFGLVLDYISFGSITNRPPTGSNWDAPIFVPLRVFYNTSFSLSSTDYGYTSSADWELTGTGKSGRSMTYMNLNSTTNDSFGYPNNAHTPNPSKNFNPAKLVFNEVIYNAGIELYVIEGGSTEGYIVTNQEDFVYMLPDKLVNTGDYLVIKFDSNSTQYSGSEKTFFTRDSVNIPGKKDDLVLIKPNITFTTTLANNTIFYGTPVDYVAYESFLTGETVYTLTQPVPNTTGTQLNWNGMPNTSTIAPIQGSSFKRYPNGGSEHRVSSWIVLSGTSPNNTLGAANTP